MKSKGIERLFYNNRQEASHNALKRFIGTKVSVSEFIDAFTKYVISQQEERVRATLMTGDFRLRDPYKMYQSTIKKEEIVRQFLKTTLTQEKKMTKKVKDVKISLQESKKANLTA